MPARERVYASCDTPKHAQVREFHACSTSEQQLPNWPASPWKVSAAVAKTLSAAETRAPWGGEWVLNQLAAALAGAGTSDHVFPCRRQDGSPGSYPHVVKLRSRATLADRTALAREAHILSVCLRVSAHVVQLSEMWQSEELAYMILRQAPGISWTRARAVLHGAVNAPPLWQRGLEERRAIERCWRFIAAALLEALAEVHRANVAHLDLRPEHVFVARDAGSGAFTASLLDFSAARELGPSGHEKVRQHAARAAQQALPRGAPLPMQDSLRAGLLLAELLYNVPVDYTRGACQGGLPFLEGSHSAAEGYTCKADGCASAAAVDLLQRLCARDARQRLVPSQALYLPVLD